MIITFKPANFKDSCNWLLKNDLVIGALSMKEKRGWTLEDTLPVSCK
jgi:hypothetical protein